MLVENPRALLPVDAYRSAVQVFTHEQLPQHWATTQYNLGLVLRYLAGRSEGAQASQYLQQAVDALRSALQVLTETEFPAQWTGTMENLAVAYEAENDLGNAQKCYEQLFSHNPTNQRLQAKVKGLSEKH